MSPDSSLPPSSSPSPSGKHARRDDPNDDVVGAPASASPSPGAAPNGSPARARIARVLAWVVTIGLLVFLLRRIDRHQLAAAFVQAHGWTLPLGLLALTGIYFADSFAMWKTFGWFAAPLAWRETLLIRGATYLIALVNYSLGQGAIIYFLNRRRGLSLMRGGATVLLIMGINVLALLFLTTAGLALGGPAGTLSMVKLVLLIAYPALAVYAALVALKPKFLRDKPLFDVLLGASLKDYARALLVRLPHTAFLIVTNVVFLWGFDVNVPLSQALAVLPLIMFITVLPISVQGLGTTQVAMVFLFGPYVLPAAAAESRIVAASLTQQAVALVFQATLGAFCVRSGVGRAVAHQDLPPPSP